MNQTFSDASAENRRKTRQIAAELRKVSREMVHESRTLVLIAHFLADQAAQLRREPAPEKLHLLRSTFRSISSEIL